MRTKASQLRHLLLFSITCNTFLEDCFFPRLNEIGVTLAGVGTSRLEPETVVAELVSELTGDRPFKCYANVERPLYEKVVCQIPVLVLDKDLRPVSDQDLAQVRLVLVSPEISFTKVQPHSILKKSGTTSSYHKQV